MHHCHAYKFDQDGSEDVNRVKKAVDKLRQITWLYKDVADDAVDDSTKQVIEVVNGTTALS